MALPERERKQIGKYFLLRVDVMTAIGDFGIA